MNWKEAPKIIWVMQHDNIAVNEHNAHSKWKKDERIKTIGSLLHRQLFQVIRSIIVVFAVVYT